MELSVLERQRAVLQRVYHQNDSWKNQQHDHHLHHRSYSSVVSDSNNLSLTRLVQITNPDWQCNSSVPKGQGNNPKKRKAEIDIEEKGVDSEEAGVEKSEITMKTERETSANTCSKESSKASEVQKPDYIHVRARRGQATDSHSLAERARREKISKKMKCLQDLVPGCNKVTGKAGMLDEIINYVKSLQKQVEFLSMKLATINPRLDCSIDNIIGKEIPAYIASLPPPPTQFDATNSTCFAYNMMQQGTSNCTADVTIDQSQILLQEAGSSCLQIPEVFLDSSSITAALKLGIRMAEPIRRWISLVKEHIYRLKSICIASRQGQLTSTGGLDAALYYIQRPLLMYQFDDIFVKRLPVINQSRGQKN